MKYIILLNLLLANILCQAKNNNTADGLGNNEITNKKTTPPEMIANPILPGFNPDPSICRVGDDYYIVTSSFAFFPGLPIYHSRDLVNWKIIGHAINHNNINKFKLDGIGDNDGVWAPTIRYHDGTFYISATMWRAGGNFIITTKNPESDWSEPIWVPDAQGIDPALFWDDNDKSYYIGNRYDFKQKWQGQTGIFIQEIDLKNIVMDTVQEKKSGISFEAPTYKLKGDSKIISHGHAANAKYAEGPHIYRIKDIYYLLMAEGGSGQHHAITVHTSHSLFGPYVPQHINPVLTHRHLGDNYPIQNIGHADLVQTRTGEWYAVCLGNRMLPTTNGSNKLVCPIGRETWLTKADIQNGQIIMAPGIGRIETEIKRPNLPWTPSHDTTQKSQLYYTPLTMSNIRLLKIDSHKWEYEREITNKSKERGIILFRTINNYYALLKTPKSIQVKKVERNKDSIVAEIPYKGKSAILRIEADGMSLRFKCNGRQLGDTMSFLPLCDDGKYNKFNGTGVGYIRD